MINNLKIIVPFYNAERFLTQCQESLLNQSYTRWKAIMADDCSTDNSKEQILNDQRFVYRNNGLRTTALYNIHAAIIDSDPDDEDIICLLDGDDFLFRKNSLEIINDLYNDQTLLTYGQYIWPNGAIGHCRPYDQISFKMLRNGGYWASHFRTFKFKLYKELLTQDPELLCYKDSSGEFFKTCYDIAIMTPLMEIAGLSRIKFNPQPVYYYRIHDKNDHAVDAAKQKLDEKILFAKPAFKQRDSW